MMEKAPLKAVALMGATGTGKSSFAIELAIKQDTCLISCDSMQVYRGLDIGTAKANLEQQQLARHELINCTDVSNIWNAQVWAVAARDIIKRENEQGKTPMIVGGTGMYLKALTHGFADIPAEKDGVRLHFEGIQQQLGTTHLHDLLKNIDSSLAERLEIQDTQRIIRGLCVYESTGVTLSEWHSRQHKDTAKAQSGLDCPVFVLEAPVEMLRLRIAQRFEHMMGLGWLEETKWLQSLALLDTHPVMRAVGYRQLLDYLAGENSLEVAIEKGITATRKYAKRQRTWFRNQTPDAQRGAKNWLTGEIRQHIDR